MSCTSTPYGLDTPKATTAAAVPSFVSVSGPYLVVSNAPEILPSANVQLYKCDIPLVANQPQKIRLFVWHKSSVANTNFRASGRVEAGTATITGAKGYFEIGPDASLGVIGNCCARALLYNDFTHTFPDNTLDATSKTFWNRMITLANNVLGAIWGFTVTPTQDTNFHFRTSVGSVAESVVPADDPARHVRGWWPYSEIELTVPGGSIDTNPGATTPGFLICPIEETNDATGARIVPPELSSSGFARRAEDIYGLPTAAPPLILTGNVGLYGVIAKYKFTATNSDVSSDHAAYVSLFGRNNGGKVFGAAHVDPPSDNPKNVVPPLAYTGGSADGCKLTAPQAIIVPASGTVTATISFTAAGASSLPGNLYIQELRSSPT